MWRWKRIKIRGSNLRFFRRNSFLRLHAQYLSSSSTRWHFYLSTAQCTARVMWWLFINIRQKWTEVRSDKRKQREEREEREERKEREEREKREEHPGTYPTAFRIGFDQPMLCHICWEINRIKFILWITNENCIIIFLELDCSLLSGMCAHISQIILESTDMLILW